MIKATPEELVEIYQSIMANADMGISILDLATGKIQWDENYRKLYEIPDGRLEGTIEEWFRFLHEDDVQRIQGYMQQFLNTDAKVQLFYRIKVTGNKVKCIRASGQRIFTDGVLTGFRGICWEDSSPMLLQFDVDNSKWFTDAVLDIIPDPLFVKNQRHEVIYANQEYEKFVGMKREVFVGKNDYEFFPKEMADLFWRLNEEAFASKTSIETEEAVANSVGQTRIVMTKRTPLQVSPEEKVLVGVVRDITEIKKIQTSMVAQSKMASLGEMAAGIAHEINNPLSIIRGRGLLLKEKNSDPKVKSDFELIEQNCIRIERIVRSLKSVSRNSSQDPFEETSVVAILEETQIIAKERFSDRNLELLVEIGQGISDMDRTRARPAEVVQVLVNLLNNSFDAIRTQKGGWAKINVSVENKEFVVEVTDSGQRIELDVAARMMEPFFTTKPTGKGTGLGLSVSKQFIEIHGSKLVYDPKHTHTRFFFVLPKL